MKCEKIEKLFNNYPSGKQYVSIYIPSNISAIYYFINKDYEVIYIGATSNLKLRIDHYIPKSFKPHWYAEIEYFSYKECESTELFFTERTKIKKYDPIYNINNRGRGAKLGIKKTKSGKPMHRPKINIDWNKYDELFTLGVPKSKIAVHLKISESKLYTALKERETNNGNTPKTI